MRQNLEGVPIPNYSEYITLHVYQFWCFYEKVNNSPKISVYAAALYYQSHGLGRLSYHVFLNKNSIEKVNIA